MASRIGRQKNPKRKRHGARRECSFIEFAWFGGLAGLLLLSFTWFWYLHDVSEFRRADIHAARIQEAGANVPASLRIVKEASELEPVVHVTPAAPFHLPFDPANNLPWVIVSSIDHCQKQLTSSELASVLSWQQLQPPPTIVLMCECTETPTVLEGVQVVSGMDVLFQSLRRLGGISVAADRSKNVVSKLAALAWMDITLAFNEASAIEFSRLFALLAAGPHPFRENAGSINGRSNQAFLALPVLNPLGGAMDFKIMLDPPRDPLEFEKEGKLINDQVLSLWTVPGAPEWAEWLTAGAGGMQDEYGEEFLDQERQRCNPPLKSCYECSTNKEAEQNCAVCKNFMYLSHGRCRKQCRPGSGQVKRGKGRFFRYCTDPDKIRLTTTTTTTTQPMLPPVMPEVMAGAVHAMHDAGMDDDQKAEMESVLLFSTIARGQSSQTTDFTRNAMISYCEQHGCKAHLHQSVERKWPGIPGNIAVDKFERYHAFLDLFENNAYSGVTTFVFIDAKGTFVKQAGDLARYLPFEGSKFDVHFGNQKSPKKVGRPNTSFIAAKRSNTALMLFKALSKGNCPIECSLASPSSYADTFDQCCLNRISEDFARVAVISQETPVQVFTSYDYTKLAFQPNDSHQPLILQCADNACAMNRPVAGHAGKTRCNYKTETKHCRDAASAAALIESSLRETWQRCETYLYDHSTKCARSIPSVQEMQRDIEEHSYSIVVSTFNRDDALLSLLPHWLGCSNVSAVLVVWHNPNRNVIERLQNLAAAYKRLTVLQQITDQLSNRYLEGHSFKTKAVFSVDDDEWYSSSLMLTAFGVWRQARGESMVAFNPRWLNFSVGSEESYAGNGYQWNGVCKPDGYRKKWEMRCGQYNTLFVTKGGFLHRKFHRAYFEDPWASPRGMVNKFSTAEDILMTAVHAATTTATNRKIIAVSALSRHFDDFYGTVSWGEMAILEKSLLKDPNSLHFLTENHRGDVRMEIIRNLNEKNANQPTVTADWFDPASSAFVGANEICTKDLGARCHVF